ncbi:hypothetical protein pipiens_012306 [Culex pipiens pipiens]|uniref:Thioredoxin domain-containing protein n=1 Tax=Culex pipiens pipiens TaxID=38569 RepID=A0ABD1D2T9_CULPP
MLRGKLERIELVRSLPDVDPAESSHVVGEQKGKVKLAKVDIDEHSDLALHYEVASVPVLLAIRNGKVEQRLVGLQDTDKLRNWVENVVKEGK